MLFLIICSYQFCYSYALYNICILCLCIFRTNNKPCFLLSRNRSGTSNLAHETGTSLQSRWSSGGRLVTPGHPLATG